jgi:hypothetical protein
MTKICSNNWVLAAVLAGALLAGCGGAQTQATASGNNAAPVTPGATGVATLSWASPTQNTDGSAVANLAGYRIYHGTSANALDSMIQVSNPGITLYVVDSLASGTHYFAVTAYNTSGAESDRSAVASKKIL